MDVNEQNPARTARLAYTNIPIHRADTVYYMFLLQGSTLSSLILFVVLCHINKSHNQVIFNMPHNYFQIG